MCLQEYTWTWTRRAVAHFCPLEFFPVRFIFLLVEFRQVRKWSGRVRALKRRGSQVVLVGADMGDGSAAGGQWDKHLPTSSEGGDPSLKRKEGGRQSRA